MTAQRSNPRRILLLLALAALALATAGCGARWNDEQRAQVLTRYENDADDPRSTDETDSDDRASGRNGSETGSTNAPSGGSAGRTGSSGSTDADGGRADATGNADGDDPATAAGGGALPCAAPSEATGVTDRTISAGSISSLSGPVPGLGASSAAAVRAHVEFRNATGGVCGRQIELQSADDGTDNGRHRSLVQDMAENVFGIAGGFAQGDVGGAEIVGQTGIPVVNVPSADAMGEQPTAFDVNPPYGNRDAAIGKYRYLRDQGVETASVTYLAVDQSRAEAELHQDLMRAAGIEVAQVQELPIATISYDSAARSVVNSGADYLMFIADSNGNAAMARSMDAIDHSVEFEEYFTFSYQAGFIDRAGDAAEGAISWIRSLPIEQAGGNEELSRFVEWMDRVAPDDVKDQFAADSWASAKAFFDGLEALPGPISREALVDQLAGIETYDAGGMIGPIQFGAERTNGCFVAMQVRSGSWQRLTPADGFLCA